MCTDETRQEVLFLVAFSRNGDPLGNTEMSKAMIDVANRVGLPQYVVHSPRSIDGLILRASEFGFIKKAGPVSWKLAEQGKERLGYIIERFVPEDLRTKLRNLFPNDFVEASARVH